MLLSPLQIVTLGRRDSEAWDKAHHGDYPKIPYAPHLTEAPQVIDAQPCPWLSWRGYRGFSVVPNPQGLSVSAWGITFSALEDISGKLVPRALPHTVRSTFSEQVCLDKGSDSSKCVSGCLSFAKPRKSGVGIVCQLTASSCNHPMMRPQACELRW